MIIIIDYGYGNLMSVYRSVQQFTNECEISSDPYTISSADKFILPGVGHFNTAMKSLRDSGLKEVLDEEVMKNRKPILGICLGVQLFCLSSEEDLNDPGLGWIEAHVRRFKPADKVRYKIPNIGWLQNNIVNRNKLDDGLTNDDEFYFVHSYYIECINRQDVWMSSVYADKFISAVHVENIYGTQFHPEKSYEAGEMIIGNFCKL